jgi:hypothetical protein
VYTICYYSPTRFGRLCDCNQCVIPEYKTTYCKCSRLEHYTIPFIIRWKLQNAEILQLVLANGPFLIKGKILKLGPLGCYFYRKSSHWCTLLTDTLESRLLSTCTLWSDRQLAATSSVTKQAQNNVGNSTGCRQLQMAWYEQAVFGNHCHLAHISVTIDSLAAW